MAQKAPTRNETGNLDEFADLEKFLSILSLKTATIITEARRGGKFTSDCHPQPAHADWVTFSLESVFMNNFADVFFIVY